MFHYFRMTVDNRITYGGGGAVRYYFNRGIAKKYGDAPARYTQLAKEFFEKFPQLGDVKFSNKWGPTLQLPSKGDKKHKEGSGTV